MISHQKQTNAPLYPDIFWNQPVRSAAAGSLLIIGGHSQSFNLIGEAYTAAQTAGIGNLHLALPQPLKKLIGAIDEAIFVPTTPSGSFAKAATDELVALTKGVDGVLLAGDISSNTETTSVISTLIARSHAPVFLTDEAIHLLKHDISLITNASLLMATPQTLSEVAKQHRIPIYIKTPNLHKELSLISALSEYYTAPIVCTSEQTTLIQRDRTPVTTSGSATPTSLAAYASVFYVQHSNHFEAVASGIWQAHNPEVSPTER